MNHEEAVLLLILCVITLIDMLSYCIGVAKTPKVVSVHLHVDLTSANNAAKTKATLKGINHNTAAHHYSSFHRFRQHVEVQSFVRLNESHGLETDGAKNNGRRPKKGKK